MAVIKWKSEEEKIAENTKAQEEAVMAEAIKSTQLDYMIDLDFRLSMIELGLN